MWLGVNLNLVSASGARVLPVYSKFLDSKVKGRSRIRVLASENGNLSSTVLSSDSVGSAAVSIGKEILNGIDSVNGKLGSGIGKKKVGNEEELEVLWEDGFGTNTVTDYFELAKDFTKPDGGPPRWFSPVECGCPVKNSPLLLFLPGMDGLGLGLVLHQKSLGRVFEVRCLHIPVYDRTPFQGLVKFVENTVRTEYALFPNRPIYLVGDSFGGCLALAVSARNPAIDLVLILANPATSFSKSPLQPLIPILEGLPEELHITVPYLLSCVMGEPVKLASVNVENRLPPAKRLEQISKNLTGLLPLLSGFNDIIPKETLLWKLKLLKSADSYTNSRLHAVKSEVLVLASGKDNMLPSKDEAQRLWNTLEKCKVRFFKENGHTLLLEDAPSLVSILKGTTMYRRSTKRDFISDYIPPSDTEYEEVLNQGNGYRVATSPVMLSTLENGKIVKGLAGVPDEGPVLFVGYHMLMGLELAPLIEEFLNVKRIMLRGMAHPTLFTENVESSLQENSYLDQVRQFGAVPVTPSNLYRLLSSKSFVLLYPGGAREALHRKGEEYKLFWPDQPEFVRMAARFEATIVPFGVVGEDDIAEMVLDYNDQMKIPILKDWIRQQNDSAVRLRTDVEGEVGEQDLFLPGVLPKIPGRFYYMFGKPIELKGKKEVMKDRENANALYLQVKSDIENIISYLKTKREQDPYRSIVDRTIYRAISMPADDVPSFDP